MASTWRALLQFSGACALAGWCVSSSGCRNKSGTPSGERPAGPAPTVSGSASAAPVPALSGFRSGEEGAQVGAVTSSPLNCRPVTRGEGVWLGTPSAGVAHDPEADDPNVERPFSVELGASRVAFNQFAVPALETRQGATYATLTLVNSEAGSGRSVELGRVYGDVEPPAVTPWEGGFAILTADNDASALVLRLSTLSAPFDAAALKRGPEIHSVRRDTQGFALEVKGHEALTAYSKLEKGKGVLGLTRFDLRSLSALGPASAAPHGADGDQESPRLLTRPGGYYLAWLLRTPQKKPGPKPHLVGTRPGLAKAGEGERAEEPVLQEGPSVIEIVPLDMAGAPVSTPRRVTPPEAHVTTFDLAATRDGGALVVYRDERDGPGLDHTNVEAIWVRPDGSTVARTWELSDSVGLPSLLVDPGLGQEQPFVVVSVPLENETRLFRWDEARWNEASSGLVEPSSHELVGNRELLGRVGDHYLSSEVRGTQRRLSVISCRFSR